MNSDKRNNCRTCLKTGIKTQSLSTKPKLLKSDKTYMELLEHLVHFKFDPDKELRMPQGICYKCCRKIREFYTFMGQVKKCNNILVNDAKYLLENHQAHLEEGPETMRLKECKKPCIKSEEDSLHKRQTLDGNCLDSSRSDKHNSTFPDKSASINAIKVESEEGDIFPQCIINENLLSDEKESLSPDNDCYDPLKEEIGNAIAKDMILPNKRCEGCNRVFTKYILLRRHMKKCNAPKVDKLRCPHCPAEFNRLHNMKVHIRKFHQTEPQSIKSQELQTKLRETFACEYCERSYHSKYKLGAHVKSKHEPEGNEASDKKCIKRFLCTLCGLAFVSETNLTIHLRRHRGEKPFKCDFCNGAFPRLYELQIHRRSHTGEKPYKCSMCEKGFVTNHKLKVHMRTHTNERPYKCTQCDKAFKQSKDLNIHRRAHTGEKPYKCAVCNSSFTQRISLKMHQTKTKHIEISNEDLLPNT